MLIPPKGEFLKHVTREGGLSLGCPHERLQTSYSLQEQWLEVLPNSSTVEYTLYMYMYVPMPNDRTRAVLNVTHHPHSLYRIFYFCTMFILLRPD